MENVTSFLILCLFLICIEGCKEENTKACVKGEVIGYQPCLNNNIIHVLSGPLEGNSLDWDGNHYDNVVQYPGAAIFRPPYLFPL